MKRHLSLTLPAVGLLLASCVPGVFEPLDDFTSCATPLPEDADTDQLRDHVQTTLPFAPRKLTHNAATPWSSSRAIAVHGSEVFVVDRDNGNLVVLDADNKLALKRTISVGARPEHVLVGPAGEAWVTVRHGAALVRIAPGGDAVELKVDVGVEPIGLAMNPEASVVYVTVAGEQKLKVVDAKSGAILESHTTPGDRPRAVTAGQGTHVVVIDQAGQPKLFNPKSDGRLSPSVTRKLRTRNPGHMLGFGNSKLQAWRALSGAVHPESGDTLVAHVLVSPGDKNSLMQQVKFGGSQPTQSSGGYGSAGDACDPGTPIRPVEVSLTQVGGKSAKMQQEFAIEDPKTGRAFITRFDQPSDVNHHPTVSLAFITAYGTDNVLVVNTGAGDVMRFPIAELRVGQAPKAIALSQDGQRAFVLNQHGFSVSEIDLRPLLDETLDSYPKNKIPKQVPVKTLAPVRTIAFAKDPAPVLVQKGRRLFTFTGTDKLSKSERFACASCHLEGSEDKMTWFISDGPRQTPSLAGRLAGTGPFNWIGSEDHLQDNMGKTIKRMGGVGLSKTELVALEQFMLVGLVQRPNPHKQAQLTEAQQRGKAIFEDAEVGCASCHVGGDGTDGANWDVGTVSSSEKSLEQMRAALEGRKPRKITFNTPSLRDVFATAPYLHDGSAKTLRQVLDRTAKTMGKTSHLSSAQKDDLIAYLKTL